MARLWTAEALAEHHFAHAFLVEPIIPRGGTVLMYGKRGIGKSHFALTLATCLSEHGALFGRYPTHALGPVVYVMADMTPAITQQRIRRARRLYPMKDLYFFFPRSFNLMAQSEKGETVQEIRRLVPSLIIWDTLRKVHRGDSIKDDTSSAVYLRSQELFPSATHLYIHHDKKTIVDQDQLDDEELFRGSGAWIDDCDTGMHLVEHSPGRLTLKFTKTRTCEDQAPVSLLLNTDMLLLYASGDAAQRCVSWWRERHPHGSPAELERFLLASFVATPRVVHQLAFGGDDEGNPRAAVQ